MIEDIWASASGTKSDTVEIHVGGQLDPEVALKQNSRSHSVTQVVSCGAKNFLAIGKQLTYDSGSTFEPRKAKKQVEQPQPKAHRFKRMGLFFAKNQEGTDIMRFSNFACSSSVDHLLAQQGLINRLYSYGFRPNRVAPDVIIPSLPALVEAGDNQTVTPSPATPRAPDQAQSNEDLVQGSQTSQPANSPTRDQPLAAKVKAVGAKLSAALKK